MNRKRMKAAQELLPVRMRFAIELDEPRQQERVLTLNASEAIHVMRAVLLFGRSSV